jgi:hypothetical protein
LRSECSGQIDKVDTGIKGTNYNRKKYYPVIGPLSVNTFIDANPGLLQIKPGKGINEQVPERPFIFFCHS